MSETENNSNLDQSKDELMRQIRAYLHLEDELPPMRGLDLDQLIRIQDEIRAQNKK